mgnify:FL=1|tara:strand:- start:261 stop:458 length:198 start_codon:yes stop_codon:yes gene_type:complete
MLKPFYIVFKYDLENPLYEGKSEYAVKKEYDEGMIWDSPIYEVLGYFKSMKEAKACILKSKLGFL